MRLFANMCACLIVAGGSMIAAQAYAQEMADATFINLDGREIGTATLTETPNGVLIDMTITNVPSGAHGFHIHEVGACDAADGFNSAGGHFAPRKNNHGYEAVGGPHAGDMPNQFAAANGTLRAQVLDPNVTLKSGDGSLLDSDSSALVLHAAADDYHTQPTGNSGARIACAVIKPR